MSLMRRERAGKRLLSAGGRVLRGSLGISLSGLIAGFYAYGVIAAANAGQSFPTVLMPGSLARIRFLPAAPLVVSIVFAVVVIWFWVEVERLARGLTRAWRIRTHSVKVEDGERLLGDQWYEYADRAPGQETSDLLGRRKLPERLATIIRRSAPNAPFVMGLEGRWGTGKTSLMQAVESELKGSYFRVDGVQWRSVTVWFNPWKHRKRDVQRAFMDAVFTRVPRQLSWYIGPVMRPRLLAQAVEFVRLLRPGGSGSSGSRVANRLDARADYRNSFEADFERFLLYWKRAEAGIPTLLVIFVDDLDRCSPADITQVLEAMKLFFEHNQCVFVLAYDFDIVARSIERDYDKVITDGSEYLSKIVQAKFMLPGVTDERLKGFLDTCAEEAKIHRILNVIKAKDTAYRTTILDATRRRPRRIKQVISSLAIIQAIHLPGDDTDTQLSNELLYAYHLILMQLQFPEAFQTFMNRQAESDFVDWFGKLNTALRM